MGLASSRFFGGASLPTTRSDAAATRALALTSLAPSRSVALPSEIVELILLSLSTDEPSLNTGDSVDWTARHDGLRAASLVSKQWGTVAQRLLYARLELKWEAGPAEKLLRTFEENPQLLRLVRFFVTIFTDDQDWDGEWLESLECEDALAEADVLFPTQGLDEWGEGDYGEDHWAVLDVKKGRTPFVAKLPNLRILSMRSMDMPIRASLLCKLAPVLARLTTIALHTGNDNTLSVFPLLHSIEVVSVYASHRDRGVPSHQSPPRELRTGQLKYMRADVADLAVLGLNFTTLVGLELQNIGEVDLFDFTHNLLPSLVNLELLSIGADTLRDPVTDKTLESFHKSLPRTKLIQLYLSH